MIQLCLVVCVDTYLCLLLLVRKIVLAMEAGQSKKKMVGPWSVEVTECSDLPEEETKDSLLAQKAIKSMEAFMDGQMEYYLEVPTKATKAKVDGETEKASDNNHAQFVPNPLVFISNFSKATRPSSWKSVDDKIQTILPLLANTDDSLLGLKDPVSNGFAHSVSTSDGCEQVVANPSILVKVTLKLVRCSSTP